MTERRKVTPEDIEVVRWLLMHGAMKDVSEYHADSLQGREAVAACPCGCASIDFVYTDLERDNGDVRGELASHMS